MLAETQSGQIVLPEPPNVKQTMVENLDFIFESSESSISESKQGQSQRKENRDPTKILQSPPRHICGVTSSQEFPLELPTTAKMFAMPEDSTIPDLC